MTSTDSSELSELQKEFMSRWYADPPRFCREVLPHWFSKPMPWVHRGILAIRLRRADFLLNFGEEIWPDGTIHRWTKKDLAKLVRCFRAPIDPTDPNSPTEPIFRVTYAEDGRKPIGIQMKLGQHVLLIMPRGFSKTTLMNACQLIDILYLHVPLSVYISDTGPMAKQQVDTISRELENNVRIREVFGNLVPKRNESEVWTADEIETKTGITLIAKGSGAQIRGINKAAERPGQVTFDDIENLENTGTIEQREKLRNWYFKDAEPILPKIKGEGHILILGTIIHSEMLLLKLATDPRFTVIRFGAIDPEGEALWDSYMSLQKIEAERQRYANLGRLSDFYSEYMSELRNDESAKFRADMFTYQARSLTDCVARALALDPAISNEKGRDLSAFAIVGMTENGMLHIYEHWMKLGANPRELINKLFELKITYKATHVGIEGVAYQAALIHLVQEEMWRKSKDFGPEAYFEVTKLMPGKTRKDERVEGILVPRYTARVISHQRAFPQYEAQLLDWPKGKKDGPDVVAMAISMLDPYAPFALEDPSAILNDQYEPLVYSGGAP